MNITTFHAIGYLVSLGFRPRDNDLKLFDFFHGDVDSDDNDYNWGIVFDIDAQAAQVL